MNLVMGYAATHPVMPAEGNHEACGACPAIPGLGESNGNNFTECVRETIPRTQR